jgi:hypothetical protein
MNGPAAEPAGGTRRGRYPARSASGIWAVDPAGAPGGVMSADFPQQTHGNSPMANEAGRSSFAA